MTGIVFYQGIDSDRSLASKMLIENTIRKRHETAMRTITTLNGWLTAYSGLSVIQTNGGIARLSGIAILPANRENIASPPKKAPEQCQFFFLRKFSPNYLGNDFWRWHQLTVYAVFFK
jgi:hypothetical protein